MDDLTGYRTQAEGAINDVATRQEGVPALLSDLRKNLTTIFAKDNPLIAKREGLLSDYLSSGARTRADILPGNLSMVAGSPLNLSPTQQSAIESARSAAAFAPLAGINQLITGEYGNLADILSNTANIYGSQIEGAKTRASGLLDLYKAAISEKEAERKAAESSGGLDLSALAAILQILGGGDGEVLGEQNIDNLDSLVEEESEEVSSPISPVAVAKNIRQDPDFLGSLSGLTLGPQKPTTAPALSIAGVPSSFANNLKNLGINLAL